MIECYSCHKMFTPDPARMKFFAQETGGKFDPTDWECEDCTRADAPGFEDVDSMFYEPGPYLA